MGKLKRLAQEVEEIIINRASDGINLIEEEADSSKEVLKNNIHDCIKDLGKKYDLTINDLEQLIYPDRFMVRNGYSTIEEKIDYFVDEHFGNNY